MSVTVVKIGVENGPEMAILIEELKGQFPDLSYGIDWGIETGAAEDTDLDGPGIVHPHFNIYFDHEQSEVIATYFRLALKSGGKRNNDNT